MRRKTVLILALLMSVLCFQYQIFQRNEARGSDGYPVHNVNTGLNYATIQDALDANETLDGHVIHVDAGTYFVNDTVYNLVNKSVSVVGDGMENTTIISTVSQIPVFYVTSDYVSISGFAMRGSEYGVYATAANYVYVTGCNISDNWVGIEMVDLSYPGHMLVGEIIDRNILMNNTRVAISLQTDNSTVSRNVVSGNGGGIYLSPSVSGQEFPTGNLVYENTIMNNGKQGCSVGGYNNTIILNNFVNNTSQTVMPAGANVWDGRLSSGDLLWGGNFWSDYNETNKYGLAVVPYVIDANNVDHYPLTGMLSVFDAPFGYEVAVVSNSSISDFQFNVTSESQAVLGFKTAGKNGSLGFCWAIVPQALISYGQNWSVTMDGNPLMTHEYSKASNGTAWNFWIDYSQSVHQVEITGFTTIPEFPTFLVPTLLIVTILLAILTCKRKRGMSAMQTP